VKVITNGTSRTGVDAPAPGEGCLRLQTMAHVLFYLSLQGVIARTRHPHQALDLPERTINGISLGGRGPKISLRDLHVRQGNIHVLDTKGLMYTARAGVAYHYGSALSKFPLNVQIPLHHVIARGVLLDIVNAQRLRVGTDIHKGFFREVSLR